MVGVSSLSETQDMALSILPCFTSLLSCLGSAQIIYMVLTGRRTTPYRRILFGLSVSDFLCSVIYPWQAFLVPQSTSYRIWAVGNDQTCTFLGFGQQIFFASIYYNSMLSVYFLLTVRCGIPNRQVAKRHEPWMHLVAIGYPLLAACIGAGLGVFHELDLGHGCWVNNYPDGCDGCDKSIDPDCSSCTDYIIAFFFGGLPAMLAFVLIVVNNILVYSHVRNTIQKVRKRFSSSVQYGSSNVANTSTAAGRGIKPSISAAFRRRSPAERSDPQLQRIRAVATQACWYVASFMMTYMSSFILRILAASGFGAEDEATLFPLLVLEAVLLPSQGWFNLFVYIRPSLWRTRRDYPSETYLWAFRRAMFGEKIQPKIDEVKRRPVSSDFGVMVVHRLNENQHKSILEKYGMSGRYDPYWSTHEIQQGHEPEQEINNLDDAESEEVASFPDGNENARESQENYWSGDDNDEGLVSDGASSTGGDRTLAIPATPTADTGATAIGEQREDAERPASGDNSRIDNDEDHAVAEKQDNDEATATEEQIQPTAVDEQAR